MNYKTTHRSTILPLRSILLCFVIPLFLSACGGSSGDKNKKPHADANGPYSAQTGDTINFSSQGSNDSDGSIVSYEWNFGDGTSSSDANPVHSYSDAGVYHATLTVTDNDNDSDSDNALITISQPGPVNASPMAEANGPYAGITGIAISFSSAGSSDSDGTITAYLWNFGDGNTSNEQNPTHSYSAAGNYSVTLSVTDNQGAQGSDTSSANISNPASSNQIPSANVNGPYIGTTGLAVNFSSAGSSDPDGSISAYEWNFGDGNSSSSANPSHSYATAGSYNVSLIVTDNDGAHSLESTTTATISDPANVVPTANVNGPYSGTTGDSVSFSSAGSSDSDGSISSYIWSFGDGDTSTSANPSHVYTNAGTYNVSLTVIDNDGASSVAATTTAKINDPANIAPVANANGPYSGTTGVSINFTSVGSSDADGSITSYSWDFGDGASSSSAFPTHSYSAAGSYNISLVVTDNNAASSSASTTTANITDPVNLPPTAIVNGPYTGTTGVAISFSSFGSTDSDGSISSYSWDFGDGNTSAEANPMHAYSSAGSYSVTLSVTDNDGATSTTASTTAIVSDPVNAPPVAEVNGPYSGSTGIAINFSSAGSSDSDGTIASYIWSFGDGNTSTDTNPAHIYSNAGDYIVNLTVIDNDGASSAASTTTATITASNLAPTANANGPYTGTTGIAVSFSSSGSSDTDGSIVAYSWDFGDGNSSSDANPTHSYSSAGSYNVILVVTDNNGANSSASTTSATISNPANMAPVAEVNGPYNGTTGVAVNFSSAGSSDADGSITGYSWDFGDGSSSSDANPTHSYSSAGTYDVSLEVTDNDGASSTASTTTATISNPANIAPVAEVNGPYNGTTGVAVVFSSLGSSDPDGSITGYNWDFGDGSSSSNSSPTHSYTAAGTYNISLTVTDNNGASSTAATTTVTIVDTASPLSAQANGPYFGSTAAAVSFTSAGTFASSGLISSYHWEFGDGASSNESSPSHTYASVGNYTVTLTVTDNASHTSTDTSSAVIQAVAADSINSTSQDGAINTTAVAQQSFSGNTAYRIFGTNDLGMHCGDFDTRISSILPPFNVLHAQVIQMGSTPSILSESDGISVYYSAATNSNDPILTGVNSSGDGDILSSIANNGLVFKTNFWDTASSNTVEPTALAAYRAFYPPGILDAFYPNGGRDGNGDINIRDFGLPMPNVERLYLGDGQLSATQQSMTGRFDPYAINTPQEFSIFAIDQPFFINFAFGYTSYGVNWFEAAGIPLTAFDDSGRENPWPLYRFQAKNDTTGTVLATTDVVVPISGEANCGFCHNASIDGGNGSATKELEDNNIAVATVLDDPEFDVSVPLAVSKEYAADLNILRLHDLKHGTSLETSTPVVCQSCHYTPALDLAHVGPKGPENDAANANGRDQAKNKSMSNVMHSHHATVRGLDNNLLFPDMPPAVDSNGNARDPALTKSILNETCYQCHPGRRTDCLRGAMANGGMVCQDCHGQLEQVGNDFSRTVGPDSVGSFELANDFYDHNSPTPRVPWANEPGCGSCHTGDARDNLYSDSNTLGSPKADDNIRLVQAFRIGDNKATPIVPSNKRFAENTVASTGNPMLYRVSKGHGGVFCEACHGATHGIWPNKNPLSNDNVTATQLQGHTGPIIECSTCHGNTNLGNTLNGPHGMHAVGETSFADGGHEHLAESSSGKNACRSCHGNNGEGTVLSRTAQARDFRGMKNGQQVAKGHQVTCTDCHSNKL